MRLYLIRHGKAVSAEVVITDSERPLVAEGRKQVMRLAQRLHGLSIRWRLIQTSPFVRARETAAILREAGLAPTVEAAAELSPAGELTDWLPFLTTWRDAKRGDLAIVGHFPNLAHWAESLAYGEARGRLVLKAGGVIALEVPQSGALLGSCELFWLSSPALLP
jgi:phosphohistidine phosphatase